MLLGWHAKPAAQLINLGAKVVVILGQIICIGSKLCNFLLELVKVSFLAMARQLCRFAILQQSLLALLLPVGITLW